MTDWTNPCERAAALRERYFSLISGGAESLIKQGTPEGDQEVRFAKAEIDRLKDELDRAEDECSRMNGQPVRPRRAAMRLGAVRRRGGC